MKLNDMHMIRRSILLLGSVIIFQSCTTNKKYQTEKAMNEIINYVKDYEEKPEYRLRVYSSNCNWVLTLNDMPIETFTREQGGMSSNLPLNYMIPKSGIQKLRLQVFPLNGDIVIGEYASFKMTLEYYEDNQDYDNFIEMHSFVLPIDSAVDTPIFDYAYEFEAKVPYILDDWTDSKDLRNIPQIEEKLLEKYKELKTILMKVDKDAYLRFNKKSYVAMYQSFYASRSKMQIDLKEDEEFVEQARNAAFYPIEEYQVVYYANGKVAELTRKDGDYLIQFKVDEETTNFVGMLLHMPSDSNELEIIR